MSVPMLVVDAFTDRPFGGNPAAVCPLTAWPDNGWLQSVAAEMNLAETAYVVPRPDGSFELRWFTPTVEVELCGHATLATAHALWQTGRASHTDAPLAFHTHSGLLTAARRGEEIELNFPNEAPSPAPTPAHLIEGLGIVPLSIHRNRFDYLVEVADEQTVRSVRPDFAVLRQVVTRGITVTSRSDDPRFDFVSRFFAPAVGVDEDPVCGSSHCCLGPFWQQRLGKSELLAHQISKRGGVLRVTCDGDRVRLAGRAVLVTQGELLAMPHG
jgi:PhzF family phenazine biosynthesis protein